MPSITSSPYVPATLNKLPENSAEKKPDPMEPVAPNPVLNPADGDRQSATETVRNSSQTAIGKALHSKCPPAPGQDKASEGLPSTAATEPTYETVPGTEQLAPQARGAGLLDLVPEPAHCGLSVKGSNVDVETIELPLLKNFSEQTYQNSDYDSFEQLVSRANNFFKNIDSERAINQNARNSMAIPESSIARQSAHMVHLMRGLWSKAEISPEARAQLGQELLERKNGKLVNEKLFKWIFEEAKNLHALIVKAEQGPLTFEHSQLGVEAVFSSKEIAKRASSLKVEMFDEWTQFINKNLVRSNRGDTNHFVSPHGANLSQDLGTKVRDEFGIPVMLGTSSGASNTAAATKFVAENLKQSMWAPGLSEKEGTEALIDAVFHFMREQIVPKTTKSTYDQMRQRLGAEAKNIDPFMIYTHSYPEVRAGVELTLDGEQNSEEGMRRSAERAKSRLDSFIE